MPGPRDGVDEHFQSSLVKNFQVFNRVLTQRCSSFLVMTYFPLRDYHILPKKELHRSLWVRGSIVDQGYVPEAPYKAGGC